MQYILTESELKELQERGKKRTKEQLKELQELCTMVADHMPVPRTWNKSLEPAPWGCIITREKKGEEWYCDDCPVKKICPYPYKSHSQ